MIRSARVTDDRRCAGAAIQFVIIGKNIVSRDADEFRVFPQMPFREYRRTQHRKIVFLERANFQFVEMQLLRDIRCRDLVRASRGSEALAA